MKLLKKVAISGVGVSSPIGTGKEEFFVNLVNGTDGICPIASFDTSRFSTHYGGEVSWVPGRETPCKEELPLALATQVMDEALLEAGLSVEQLKKQNCVLVVASAVGGVSHLLAVNEHQGRAELTKADYGRLLAYPHHALTDSLVRKYSISNGALTNISACTASNAAIGYAYDLIACGLCDMAIVVGVDILTPFEYACFDSYRALEKKGCRPFDNNRSGLALSEGAAALVLEAQVHLKQRKKRAKAFLTGYGLTNDAFDITAPDPSGHSAAEAMRIALESGGKHIHDVDYICAHGTGTKLNDVAETAAIKRLFGNQAYQIPVSSIKSCIGHTNGAAAAISAATCVLSIEAGVVPPTIHLEVRDESCDLDYVSNKARKTEVSVCLSNAYAFGGQCSSVLITKTSE